MALALEDCFGETGFACELGLLEGRGAKTGWRGNRRARENRSSKTVSAVKRVSSKRAVPANWALEKSALPIMTEERKSAFPTKRARWNLTLWVSGPFFSLRNSVRSKSANP